MVESGLDFIVGLDLEALIGVFWFYFLFELPRYTLSTLAIGWRVAFQQESPLVSPNIPISVMMVGHNEGHALERSVKALREQTHSNIQIVVVEDGSTDHMAKLGRRLEAAGLVDRFQSTGLRGGKAAALNLALQLCDNEIVVVIDVDTSLDRDAIGQIVAPLLVEPDCAAVAGNLAVRNPDQSLITQIQAIEYASAISVGRQFTSMFGILTIVSGAFGAFRKSAVLAVGGWDVGPGDDSNLTAKLRRAGRSIRFAQNAWALTDVPHTLGAYFRQRLRWNRSMVRNRLRKFILVLDPRQANFAMSDVIAWLNMFWFQFVASIAYVYYFISLFIHFGGLAFTIIAAVHLLGLASSVIEFGVAITVLRRLKLASLMCYLPGYILFGCYCDRPIRLLAYLSELIFRHSYQDDFYPTKVRQMQDQF